MRWGVLLIFALAAPSVCQAALITWEINARITSVDPDLSGYASVGDLVRYRMTFDDATPDAEPDVPERGTFNGAIVAAELFLGAQTASANGNVGHITIVNDFATPARDHLISSTVIPWVVPLATFNGFTFELAGFSFKDLDALMFTDDALRSDSNFAGSDEFTLNLVFHKPIAPNVYLGNSIRSNTLVSIERIATVPLPSTAVLVVAGMFGAGVWRRFRACPAAAHAAG